MSESKKSNIKKNKKNHIKYDVSNHVKHDSHYHSYKKKVKTWKTISIVAIILFVVTLVLALVFTTPSFINKDYISVGEDTVAFLEDNFPIDNIELSSVIEDRGVLKHIMSIDENPLIIYTTIDGGLIFIPGGSPIDKEKYLEYLENQDNSDTTAKNNDNQEINVAKADVPKVEAFVMSHCPYGTQIEKGLLPVVRELGDSIDFKIKFVNYSMHGEIEVKEQTLQYCLQEENPEIYYDYLSCFLEDGNTDRCLEENNISRDSLESCINSTDETYSITKNLEDQSSYLNGRYPLFLIHDADNIKYDIKGSPTLVINGEVINSSRDSESLMNIICSSFNNAPDACNTELSSVSPSPGFGYSAANNSSPTSAQCS